MAREPTSGSDQSSQQQVMLRLNRDHQHIAVVLEALVKALDNVGNADASDVDVDWSRVREIITYLEEYPDAVHHPLEDQMFDRVLDKGLTPAERELIHFNLAQHEEIIAATQKLAGDVDNILNDIVVPIDQVSEHFVQYVELQRIHMRNENTHLFPLANRLMSNQDWQQTADEVDTHQDPMFELQLGKFASLYSYITDEQAVRS